MRPLNHPVSGSARGDPIRHRVYRIVVGLLAATAVVALLPTNVSAESTAEVETPTHPIVASYANDYGVELPEAQRRLERIPEMQDILASLRAAESERVAGWGIDHHGPMTAWIWLVGAQPPNGSAAEIAAAHNDVVIRTGARVTFASLSAAQDTFGVGAGIGAVGNTGATDATQMDLSEMVTHTAVDMRANALEIGINISTATATPSGALDPEHGIGPVGPLGASGGVDSSERTLDLVALLIAPHIDVPFKIIEAEHVRDETAFEGGHRMTNGTAVCTSGFSVYHRGSSRYGMLTAGHCNKTSWTTQGTTLTFESRQHNRFLDAAVYLIPAGQSHQVTNKIICVNNSATQDTCGIRSIGPSRLDMADVPVCHSGARSGVSCGTVDNVSYAPNPTNGCDGQGGPCAAVYVRATGPGMQGCKGDSGGPVYSWSAAYGIHKGSDSGNDCNLRGVSIHFSAIRRVTSILGVDVITSGSINVP